MFALPLLGSAGYTAPLAAPAQRAAVRMESVADLEALATKCNPTIKFWCASPTGSPTAAHSMHRLRHTLSSPCSFRAPRAQGPARADGGTALELDGR